MAQSTNEKQYRISIKPAFGLVSSVEKIYRPFLFGDLDLNKPSYGFDINYKLSNSFDIGIYSAYSNLLHPYIRDGYAGYSFSKSKTFFYGISSEIHFIPLLGAIHNSRFDIYSTVKIGMANQFWFVDTGGIDLSDQRMSKTSYEVSIGLGMAYMFTKTVGVFAEYNIGNLYNDDITRMRVGLKIKL